MIIASIRAAGLVVVHLGAAWLGMQAVKAGVLLIDADPQLRWGGLITNVPGVAAISCGLWVTGLVFWSIGRAIGRITA